MIAFGIWIRLSRIVLAIAAVGAVTGTAAFDPADPATIERNREIVSKTPGTDGIFTVQPNGDILHVQSGLQCPAYFPHMTFWHAQIFPSDKGPGTDIGCDYGRNNGQGKPVSKLTIFAIKGEGVTLDEAFEHYKSEIEKTYPAAVYTGPAINLEKAEGGPSALDDFQSAEYKISANGMTLVSDLVVAVRSGWIIEIRGSFVAQNPVIVTPGDDSAAINAVGDQSGPLYALLFAVSSVNGSNSKP